MTEVRSYMYHDKASNLVMLTTFCVNSIGSGFVNHTAEF